MGHPFTRHDISWRLEDCKKYKYDPYALSEVWRISCKGAAGFMRHNCPDQYYKAQADRKRKPEAVRVRPEYENQRLFDLYILDRVQWCGKWDIPLWEYGYYLRMYERKCGEIITPEIRELWEADMER